MIQRTASELAALCGAILEGDGGRMLVGPAALAEAQPDQVSFLRSTRDSAELEATRAGAVVVPLDTQAGRRDLALLRCEDPSRAFSRVVEAFRPAGERPLPGIHPSATVASDARLGQEVSIGPSCVIGAGAELGPRVVLHACVVVGPLVRIGADTEIHPGAVLYGGVTLGRRCLVHAGVVVGSDGFGFEPGEAGWEKVPQCGTVEIGDDVEIGANSAIDRGRFSATRIGNGVKIDNLVHVGHNVVVGDGALLVAQVGIAGSSRIGEGAILAGQAGIGGHLEIGPRARIAAQSGVADDLPGGQDYFGCPAREKREAFRLLALYGKLPELVQRIRDLEHRLEELARRDT